MAEYSFLWSLRPTEDTSSDHFFRPNTISEAGWILKSVNKWLKVFQEKLLKRGEDARLDWWCVWEREKAMTHEIPTRIITRQSSYLGCSLYSLASHRHTQGLFREKINAAAKKHHLRRYSKQSKERDNSDPPSSPHRKKKLQEKKN